MNHKIKHEKFEGPIATLHEMIENKKLSISEFSLVQIVEDFLAYVKSLDIESEFFNKEEITHFISVASVLILLKSKSLLPELELTEEENRDIAILENQLAAFEIIKNRVKSVRDVFSKSILLPARIPYKSTSQIFVPDSKMDNQYFYNYLVNRLEEIIPKEDPKKEVKVHKTLKIEDALSHVRSIISRIKSLNFKNLNNEGDERLREKNKRNVVILFLAVLELVKMGEIDVVQSENFSDILVVESSN